MVRKILISLCVLALIIAFVSGCTESPANPVTPTSPAIKSPATFSPIVIRGTGDKTSMPFEITTEEWIIEWSFQTDTPEYALMNIFIYPRGETAIYAEALPFLEETSGSSYSYAGAGEYYAKVQAANINAWTITIKPPK